MDLILPDHVSLAELRLSDELRARSLEVLSEDELLRREGFKHGGRKDSFALGRLALKSLLSERTRRPPEAVDLEVLDDGSLAAPGSGLRVSISHSGPYAAAAVAPVELGLDLEVVKPRPESLYRFILGPEEAALPESVPLPADTRIALFWTLKEAVLKGKRTGLRRSPKSLRLEIDLAAGSAMVYGNRVWEARFSIRADHVIAVAWTE